MVNRLLGFFSTLFFFLILSTAPEAVGDELLNLYRGTRAQAMGGAFTAVADDEEAIFYNAAGLAGIKNLAWNILAIDADVSNDLLSGYTRFSTALQNPGFNSLNQFMGQNLYGRLQGTTTFVLPGFGFAGLFDYQASLILENPALPSGVLRAMQTYGVQIAFGKRIKRFAHNRGEIRIGVAGKMLWRSGGVRQLTLTDLLTLDAASISKDLSQIGTGLGVDLGLQSIYNFSRRFSLLGGIAITNIGDVTFTSPADHVKQNLTVGAAIKYDINDVAITVAYDQSNILTNGADWRQKTHLGTEIKLRLLSLYAGLNQFYPTYGVGLDLWLVKVMYTSYAQDQASIHGVNPERRQLIHVALKFDI